MTLRNLSTRDQLRELGNATAAGFCGACFGLLLGFGNLGGAVWYDLRAGLVLAVALFAVFFCSAILAAIIDLDD